MSSQPPETRADGVDRLQATGLAGLASPEGVRVWVSTGPGRGIREDVPLDEVSDVLGDAATLVWIDLIAPTAAALRLLQAECALHPLAIEDAQHGHERPKIDEYAHYYFMVFYAASREPGAPTFSLAEINLFVGRNFLVTVHADAAPQVEESVRRWRRNSDELGHDISTLLYSLLDSLVDAYFPILDEIADRVDAVQTAIFTRPDRRTLEELAQVRRDLLRIRKVLAPEREVINMLLRRDRPILPSDAAVYFHDIYDHIVRLVETIDTYRDLLGAATDSYLSLTSNNLNEVMKTLTGWAIILMSATLIAGIYGMNFQVMPELAWPLGYPLALGLMLLVGGGLFLYFRRRGWL